VTDPLTPRPNDPTPPPAPSWQPPAPAPAPAAAPLILPTVKPKAASSRLGTYLLGLAVLVAAAGVAFAAGRVTAPAAATNGNFPRGSFGAGFGAGASFAPGGFGGGAALGANGGVSLSGKVIAIDGSTMTLQLASGQTITIDLPSTTTYHTATTASNSAVTTGSSVVVEVTGFGGRGLGGGARASGAPGASGAASITASDVTVETP
jgi:hypothetical protein